MAAGDPRPGIEEEGQALVERLGGRWTSAGGMCRCPAHDDRTPSLSVRPGRTRLLLHCFAGCAARDILNELRSLRLIEPARARRRDALAPSARRSSANAARRVWSEARPVGGTLAQSYLAARGLASDSPQLRYHPRTPSGPAPLTRYRPALIAAVRGDEGLIAIHRTFLDSKRGSDVCAAGEKRGLGPFGTGAVRLGGAGPRLGLAEGIETALSAAALFGIPCWAALGAERFPLISLPSQLEELLLFLDHDSGGRRAEALARKAFAHLRRIEAHYPPRPGADWNDVLLRGASGARPHSCSPGDGPF
jgi:putative DNA primase/helicase